MEYLTVGTFEIVHGLIHIVPDYFIVESDYILNDPYIVFLGPANDEAVMIVNALQRHVQVDRIKHIAEGVDGLGYLLNMVEPPRLIIIDSIMLNDNGIKVLQVLRTVSKIKFAPIVVLSSSEREKEIIDSYKLSVNAYLVRPKEQDAFVEMLDQLGEFWVTPQPPSGH